MHRRDVLATMAGLGFAATFTAGSTVAAEEAVIPTIAVVGVGLGTLLGGAIFVEVIFARAGLGMLIYNSIQTRNYPIVRGGVLVVALLFVLVNLLTDFVYRLVDPRIRVVS